MAGVRVGDNAPLFRLKDQDGKSFDLKDALGTGPVVIFFYPKDFTRVCTKEVCAFRDSYEDFRDAGAEVIGISSDGTSSHNNFASKHRLPFRLLTDPGRKTRNRYGATGPLFGIIPGRVTYVIDQRGIVRHAFDSMREHDTHVEEALKVIRQIQQEGGASA